MIKFIKLRDESNRYDTTNITIELPGRGSTITEVVEAFNDFLKACTYGKQVEIVEDMLYKGKSDK